MREKIAVVVQRYGVEVNGGAEFYARLLSERLNMFYEVEVLTTCALDHITWNPYYSTGTEIVNGITVKRFANYHRNYRGTDKRSKHAFQQRKWHHRLLKGIGLFRWFEEKFDWFQPTLEESHAYLENHGPYSPQLIEYIKTHRMKYDVFIFMTYLYHPTAVGLFYVKDKSIFIPTAHNEQAVYNPYFAQLFSAPKWIFYLTEAEKRLCDTIFGNLITATAKSAVVGIGVDLPDSHAENHMIRKKYNLPEKYILYMGRIDKAKGCNELFTYFLRYVKERCSDIHLVLTGKSNIKIPEEHAINYLGFIEEEDKLPLLQNSLLCVVPSRHESLSLIALESYAAGKPILVNGRCPVLKEHVQASGVGKYYYNYKNFKNNLDILLSETDNQEMAKKCRNYIYHSYSWNKVLTTFSTAITNIIKESDIGVKKSSLNTDI